MASPPAPRDLHDAGAGGAPAPRHINTGDRRLSFSPNKFRGGRTADAVADLFEQHRIIERGGGFAQPAQRAGEVGVPVVLHRLLQRIGVHGQGVRTHPIERLHQMRNRRLRQLRQTDVAEQQDIRGHIANREAVRGAFAQRAVEHDPLRPQHHADSQLLSGCGQIPVDRLRHLGAPGHGADEDRRPQVRPEERGGHVDVAQTGLCQCVVGQSVAVQPGCDAVEFHRVAQTHVDVPSFPVCHRVHRGPRRVSIMSIVPLFECRQRIGVRRVISVD